MYHLTNGLDGLDVGFFLHENKVLFSNRDNDVVRVLVRRLKKRLLWESSSTPMHSSPTLPSCTSQPDSQVSLAPRTTCGSRGASKKKVWVHGLLQRVHPRLVGSSRENRNANFAFSQLALSESINKSNPREALSSPPGHSATANIPSTFPLVRILTPSHFTHRDFPFLLSTSSKKHQIILCTFADKRIKECPASTLVANTSLRPHRPHLQVRWWPHSADIQVRPWRKCMRSLR